MCALNEIHCLPFGHLGLSLEKPPAQRTTVPAVRRKLFLYRTALGRLDCHLNFQIESRTPVAAEWSVSGGPTLHRLAR